jgi:pimeloyl-ACP methyl ester carboxylesterase
MRATPWTFIAAQCFGLLCLASPSTAPALTATTVPTSQPGDRIPRDTLASMYAQLLGDKFDASMTDSLIKAHELLEEYFDNPTMRKETIEALEATKIDPNILGRIVRIRIGWPSLKGGVYYINEKYGPYTVKYFLGLPPGYDRAKSWPLVIKLPVADEFVREPRPTADRVTAIYHHLMEDELKRHPDAICLMPLLNLDELWGPSYAGMHTVIQPMHHAFDRVNIDPARVYLVGHSMSGHAVWNLALHYPTYFAAINPMAGGASAEFQRLRVMNLRNVFPVVWHDSTDKVIKVDSSRALARILKQFKIDLDYQETRGIGHVPTDQIVEERYAKTRSRARAAHPKRITMQSNRPDTIFNRIDWAQIYQPMRAGDENWIFFKRGYGHMVIYSNTFKLDTTLAAPNRIEATTDNVGILRFYVNDQMIDFANAVGVIVNKKGAFEGVLKPSVEVMLEDQLFLGRGWRYFTAFIDVDLMPKPLTRATTAPATRN